MNKRFIVSHHANRFRIIASTIAVTLGLLSLFPHLTQAQERPAISGAQAINSTVFRSEHIKSVTAITEVFGRSQRTTAAIIEYDAPIRHQSVSAKNWTVAGRNITQAYTNNRPEKTTKEQDGRFVVIELNPEDESAITYSPDTEKPATVVVTQIQPVKTVTGANYTPTSTSLINTRQVNLIVDDFQQFRFTDPETGLLLTYNLYIPKNYDATQSYPLVLFMHDAGVTGTNPLRTLQQGLGAVLFASPEDQAKHPSFVLAPQYPVALANDASQISDYADVTVRLIRDLEKHYNINNNRLYTTGQSGGCMTSIALNIKYPNLFAASLLVAGQWDPSQVASIAKNKLWIIVSQDDGKAWPGMNTITQVLESHGARITRATWNGQSNAKEFANNVDTILAIGVDSNVFYTVFEKGTVIPKDAKVNGGSGHVWTWPIAYNIPKVRDWLFAQQR